MAPRINLGFELLGNVESSLNNRFGLNQGGWFKTPCSALLRTTLAFTPLASGLGCVGNAGGLLKETFNLLENLSRGDGDRAIDSARLMGRYGFCAAIDGLLTFKATYLPVTVPLTAVNLFKPHWVKTALNKVDSVITRIFGETPEQKCQRLLEENARLSRELANAAQANAPQLQLQIQRLQANNRNLRGRLQQVNIDLLTTRAEMGQVTRDAQAQLQRIQGQFQQMQGQLVQIQAQAPNHLQTALRRVLSLVTAQARGLDEDLRKSKAEVRSLKRKQTDQRNLKVQQERNLDLYPNGTDRRQSPRLRRSGRRQSFS